MERIHPGMTIGLLTALRPLGGRKWAFLCGCGKEKAIAVHHVKNGATKSCGCGSFRRRSERETLPEYHSWNSMKGRCLNPRNKKYHRYGGRGIALCARWHSFDAFRADMGARPPGTTLGRINNDGPYEPGNCRWETPKQQGNNKSNLIPTEGATSLKDRAATIGVSYHSLYYHMIIKRRPQADVERFLLAGGQQGNLSYDGHSPRYGTGKRVPKGR